MSMSLLIEFPSVLAKNVLLVLSVLYIGVYIDSVTSIVRSCSDYKDTEHNSAKKCIRSITSVSTAVLVLASVSGYLDRLQSVPISQAATRLTLSLSSSATSTGCWYHGRV